VKPTHKKYTLAIPARQSRKPKIAREYFFSHPNKIKKQKISHASKNKTSFHRTVRTSNICASIVNRLEQTVCGLQTVVLRTNSKAAHNIRLKEILKRRALFGNQTVVFLTGSGALTNSGASNPFFLKLL
jgi:hypothetical protein